MPYSDTIAEIAARVNNWGRWGDDDRLGTLNFITDEVVVAAAKSIRRGQRFSLAYPLRSDGLQIGLIEGRTNPERTMISLHSAMLGDTDQFVTNDDAVTMGLQAATHWDGLCHAGYKNSFYNGVPFSSVDENGASVLGIEHLASLTSRGVLLDVARLYEVDELPHGHPIDADDLRAAEKAQGVTVRGGDIVLIRTGAMARAAAGDLSDYYGTLGDDGLPKSAGVSVRAAEFFHERDVAAVATDNVTFEVFPWDPTTPGDMLAVHCIHLVDMGLTQGQNWVLEDLADDCARDGQWDFFLEASPQPFVGACGSPVNPVAIK